MNKFKILKKATLTTLGIIMLTTIGFVLGFVVMDNSIDWSNIWTAVASQLIVGIPVFYAIEYRSQKNKNNDKVSI